MKASSGLSLWHLKLRLSETAALGVHARNARIFALRQGRWEELLEDELSLAGKLLSSSILHRASCCIWPAGPLQVQGGLCAEPLSLNPVAAAGALVLALSGE